MSEEYCIGVVLRSCSMQCRITSAPRCGLESTTAVNNDRTNLGFQSQLATRIGSALRYLGRISLYLMIDDDRRDVWAAVVSQPRCCGGQRQRVRSP
jgi:hypothetical protein